MDIPYPIGYLIHPMDITWIIPLGTCIPSHPMGYPIGYPIGNPIGHPTAYPMGHTV